MSSTAIAEIVQADQCDAAGQHDAAINLLARATQRGDVDATTRLAKRLIVGDRAPCLPHEGARFLIDATNLGGAEASARLAVLAALGAYVTQSWQHALDLLVRAAELGWAQAQGQLEVLAGVEANADFTGIAPSGTSTRWRELRGKVDLTFWSTPAVGTTLHDVPHIRAFAKFLPAPVCGWLIERARHRLGRAEVYDPVAGKDVVSATRTNSAAKFDLVETDLVHLLVQTRMAASCGLPLSHMEGATVLHYAPGERMTPHYDFVDPRTPSYAHEIDRNGQRVLTFLVYLNEDYPGGETDFPQLNVRYKGQRGDGLYFINAHPTGEPDVRMLHAGLPPLSGEKWLLSQFVRSHPVLQTSPPRP